MNKIKAGDIVSLNSGSPKMTVRYVRPPELRWSVCDWFDKSGVYHYQEFEVNQLKKSKC